MGFGFGFNAMNSLFTIMFLLVFAITIGTFVVTAIRGIGQWNKNNHSPRLTVDAKIVAKRTDIHVRRRANQNSMAHTHRSTTYYYVTFEVESGDRMELQMQGNEYGLLVEGDSGKLTFQGTRYLGFERQ